MSRNTNFRNLLAGAVVLSSAAFSSFEVDACSRLLMNQSEKPPFVARSVDFFEDPGAIVHVKPRGIRNDGGAGKNSAHWVSRYGSVVVTILGSPGFMGEGINTEGLAFHGLLHEKSDFEQRDNRPGVLMSRYGQFLLDNAGSVSQALQLMSRVQLVEEPTTSSFASLPVHIALEDASGDSAIIEFDAGVMKTYQQRDYNVLTNSPSFPDQLENLKKYRYMGMGGTLPLPGEIDSSSRFVRGSAYLKTPPSIADQQQAVSFMQSAIRGVSSPFGTLEYDDVGHPNEPPSSGWPTVITLVYDLQNRHIFYNQTNAGNYFRIEMDRVDFSSHEPEVCLDPAGPNLHGEVSHRFTKRACWQHKLEH